MFQCTLEFSVVVIATQSADQGAQGGIHAHGLQREVVQPPLRRWYLNQTSDLPQEGAQPTSPALLDVVEIGGRTGVSPFALFHEFLKQDGLAPGHLVARGDFHIEAITVTFDFLFRHRGLVDRGREGAIPEIAQTLSQPFQHAQLMHVGDVSGTGPTAFRYGLLKGLQSFLGSRVALLYQFIKFGSSRLQLFGGHGVGITAPQPGISTFSRTNKGIGRHTEHATVGHVGDRTRTFPVAGQHGVLKLG